MSLDIDIDLLISLVQERPVLWDRTLDIYKDKNQSREAWKDVFCVLNPTYEEMSDAEKKNYGQLVMKKWWNVRDQYVKYKNKEKMAKRSGAGATKLRKYIYHDVLQFLEKCLLHAETASSIDRAPQEAALNEELTLDDNENPSTPTGPTPTTSQPCSETPGPSTKRKEPVKTSARQGKKKPMDEFEINMLKVLQTPEPDPDRHLLFFKGVVPSLSTFDENQILDFQMGVLQLIKDIKSRENFAHKQHFSSYSQSMTHHDQYRQSQPYYMPPYSTSAQPAPPRATPSTHRNPGLEHTQQQPNQQTDSSNETTLYSPYSDESNVF